MRRDNCVFPGDLAMRRKFHAVTIINVGSVDFGPYIRLLLGAIDGFSVMDHLVITDGDPPVEGGKKTKKAANRPGAFRRLAQELGAEAKLTVAAATYTLEADLLAEGTNAPVLKTAYLAQHPYKPSQGTGRRDGGSDPRRRRGGRPGPARPLPLGL
jgi:putative ATP-dependent endonuclease of OLD family